MKLEKLGIKISEILLPGTGYEKWAVIACDQYTSQRGLWKQMEQYIGSRPSTIKLMLPEVYLEDNDVAARQDKINDTMHAYLENGVFKESVNSMIYIQRQTTSGMRSGLVCSVNLDEYDYGADSTALIRSTEETIKDRLPPRIKIRMQAPIEMPHIMLLIDDEDFKVIKPLNAIANEINKLYDFELMTNGGNIKGFKVPENYNDQIADALDDLRIKNNGLLFAVGDGNHSLAAAKKSLKQIRKSTQTPINAQYALVEIVNLHDYALEFEPIHRILFNCGKNADHQFADILSRISIKNTNNMVSYMFEGQKSEFAVSDDKLEVVYIEKALQIFLNKNPYTAIDYVHGDDIALNLAKNDGIMALILPAFDKKKLFKTVEKFGQLPRKSFSIGHAQDKRYYIECRRIKD